MRKIKEISLCFVLTILFVSCNFTNNKNKKEILSDEDLNVVNINDEYSLSLPTYLRKASNLNEDASLQYQNLAREAYVIVIDEPKEDIVSSFKEAEIYNDSISLFENYIKFQNDFFNDALDDKSYDSGLLDLTINNWPAKTIRVRGKYYQVDFEIAYWIAYVETDEKMYNIMCWTLSSNQLKYEETFRKVIRSFKTI